MALTANVSSEQNLQVVVSGPGDVANMHVISGIAHANLSAFASAGTFEHQQATFAAHVGPALTPPQFRKATATVAITSLNLSGDGSFTTWEVTDVDADLDDEVGRIELTFDLRVMVSASTGGVSAVLAGVGFQVFVLTT
jgi:hypothetical protein